MKFYCSPDIDFFIRKDAKSCQKIGPVCDLWIRMIFYASLSHSSVSEHRFNLQYSLYLKFSNEYNSCKLKNYALLYNIKVKQLTNGLLALKLVYCIKVVIQWPILTACVEVISLAAIPVVNQDS